MRVLEKNMQMLQVTGFWIDRSAPRRLGYYIKRVISFTIGFYAAYNFSYGFPMYIYKNLDDFGEVSECLGNFIGSLIPLTIYLTFVLKNDELTELVQLLRNVDELYPPYDEYTKAVDEHTKKWCRFWSVTFPRAVTVMLVSVAIVTGSDAVKDRNFERRVKSVYPFDVNQPGLFGIVFVAFTANFVGTTFMVFSCNFMILCMFLNMRGQLRSLNHKFGTLRSTAEAAVRDKREVSAESLTSIGRQDAVENCLVEMGLVETHGSLEHLESRQEIIPEEVAGRESAEEIEIQLQMEDLLKDCIAHHCDLLKFIRTFEEYWNAFFSVNLVVCLAQSVLVLTSSSMKTGSASLLVHSGLIGTFYSMLGIFCFLSQQITVESELLQESIYGCGWTDASKSFKRSVGVMVSVTNELIVITAAGFIPLSLDTFKSVINSAYQSYMVLSSF